MHSGLFLRRLDTDLEFIHPSFRAFLAAFTLSESDIPSLEKKVGETRCFFGPLLIQSVFLTY